ncbi:Hydantoin racemase [Hartmannibacter diazotrophicus]|uniref:Hydantoin racemase n=1 Tax=Hartmannibacter diazotrophicus TaxID=1482074 RepID=A0A2C9D956_9HYPH|nr:aspartate/glutamate racemase family protein [Hartmannibacter diazotrophicus]SON56827.1 Hydantoin racemase [Hartmannibacter diazotrophicus]
MAPDRILLINPNTSAAMTDRLADLAQGLMPGSEVVPVTARFGAEVIATRAGYAIAGHAALDAYACQRGTVDAVLLTCFGDPGLEALREVASVPVVGLLEASVQLAGRAGRPFGIVTAGRPWGPMLDERVNAMPERSLYRGTRTLDFDGLALARDPDMALAAMIEAAECLANGGAEQIILGGAAMVGWGARMGSRFATIDCLKAAALALQSLPSGSMAPADPVRPIASQGLSPELARLLANPSGTA